MVFLFAVLLTGSTTTHREIIKIIIKADDAKLIYTTPVLLLCMCLCVCVCVTRARELENASLLAVGLGQIETTRTSANSLNFTNENWFCRRFRFSTQRVSKGSAFDWESGERLWSHWTFNHIISICYRLVFFYILLFASSIYLSAVPWRRCQTKRKARRWRCRHSSRGRRVGRGSLGWTDEKRSDDGEWKRGSETQKENTCTSEHTCDASNDE